MKIHHFGLLALVLACAVGQSSAQKIERVREDLTFINFESPHVHPLDLSPNGERLAACNTANATIELFDATSGDALRLLASIPVGLDPVSVRFRSDGELWAVNHLSDTVSVIDVASRQVTGLVRPARPPSAQDP